MRLRRALAIVSLCVVGAVSSAPRGAAETASSSRLDGPSIDAMLADVVAETGLPGLAAVVTVGDRVVYSSGFGHDSRGHAVDARSRFRIASVSKSFTAAAVLQLVEAGRLRLDDRVTDVLPEFRLADERADRITVRHLLQQTSGLQDRRIPITDASEAHDLSGFVSALAPGKLVSDPGSQFHYCNANYEVAARVVEAISGLRFADYMRAQIFAPLGMTDTTIGDAGHPTADGYISLYPSWLEVAENRRFVGGAGGVVTTAADLGQWLKAQNGLRPDVLTPATLSRERESGPGGKCAMGWIPSTEGGTANYEHPGNLFTYTADQVVIPEHRVGFAVLANSITTPDVSYQAVKGLKALTAGLDPPSPRNDARTVALCSYAVAIVSILLAIGVLIRLPRWRDRSAQRGGWRTALGVGPWFLMCLPLAGYRWAISQLMPGRLVEWWHLLYATPSVLVALAAMAVGGVSIGVGRVITWFRLG